MITPDGFYNKGSGEPMYPGYGVGDNYGLNVQGLRGLGDVTTGPNPSDSYNPSISLIPGLDILTASLAQANASGFNWSMLAVYGLLGVVGYQLFFTSEKRKQRGERVLSKTKARHREEISGIERRYGLRSSGRGDFDFGGSGGSHKK